MIKKSLLILIVLTIFQGLGYAQTYMSKSIQHAGLTRQYSIYIPTSYDGSTNVPILFNFHGGNDIIANWQTTADMRPLADTANFILVYPQARPDPTDGNSLNWLPKVAGTYDDVPFVNALIDSLANDYLIDMNRIYACGYSLGGEFCYELACKLNTRIAAISVVARTMQGSLNSYCTPVHPTGVLTILGTNDNVSPYNGLIFNGIEYYISAAATHKYWAKQNTCDTIAVMSSVSPSVERYTWSTASGCAYVEELKVIGGGHDWPGSFGNTTINANREIWKFVSRYDMNGLIGCPPISIHEYSNQYENFRVYPNPVNSQLTIEITSATEKVYRIYSPRGELVMHGRLNSNITNIDIGSLPSSVYIVNIDSHSIKLVKTE